jgi:hypothetical protein
MKKIGMLLLIFLNAPAVRGGEISYEAGWTVVTGIMGLIGTAGSLIGWYFHQSRLKRDFSRKEAETHHIIQQLQGSSPSSLRADLPSLQGGSMVVSVSESRLPAFSTGQQERRGRREENNGGAGALPLTPPPPYFPSNGERLLAWGGTFHSISLDNPTSDTSVLEEVGVGPTIVGSRPPSSLEERYDSLRGQEV